MFVCLIRLVLLIYPFPLFFAEIIRFIEMQRGGIEGWRSV
jgi:hypothetical protein